MRCGVAAVRVLLTATGILVSRSLPAQQPAATSAARPPVSVAFDALLEGMACRQHKSGRMDCEFRVGSSVRFVVAGVGQEDVTVAFVQADSNSEFIASMVPLHGCVVVKPTRTADATRAAGIPASDSVQTFAFVSPRTGRVYRNWPTCLSATRAEPARAEPARTEPARLDVTVDQKKAAQAKSDSSAGNSVRQDSIKAALKADSLKRARSVQPPASKPPS